MNQSLVDKVCALLPPPVYLITFKEAMQTVDKLTLDENKKWKRERYVVTAGQQCTCMGWMKTGKCKHLNMVKGTFTGDGVVGDVAFGVSEEIIDLIKEEYPEKAEATDMTQLMHMPSVGVIQFTFEKEKINKSRIIAVKRIGTGSVAIQFDLIPKSK